MTVEYANTVNDNEIVRTFMKDGAALNLSAATKFEIQVFAAENDTIDRNAAVLTKNNVDDASLFDITDIAAGNITFKPDSSVMTLLTGNSYYARYVVFSTDYTDGIVWDKELFEISVRI